MRRNRWLSLCTLMFAGIPLSMLAPPEPAVIALRAASPSAVVDSRPNIVFVTTDDMRVGDLSAMPNVQRLLVAEGTTFSNSYAPFPPSGRPCGRNDA